MTILKRVPLSSLIASLVILLAALLIAGCNATGLKEPATAAPQPHVTPTTLAQFPASTATLSPASSATLGAGSSATLVPVSTATSIAEDTAEPTAQATDAPSAT